MDARTPQVGWGIVPLKEASEMLGRRGCWSWLLAALIALKVVSAPVSADEFYIPPGSLAESRPGDVLRWREASAGPPAARELADAWQLMYRSTDARGEPVAVTATVLVPRRGDQTEMPVIGMGPGTQGPAFRCAASRMIDQGAFYEQAAVNDMLERGYAVAITDYEGYRPDPAVTYMVGRSMGAALTDAVRAAQRLEAVHLSEEAPVIFRGYSQGGGAAMWAGQMQPDYAPDLELAGVAAGGVPANLANVALPLDGEPGFGVMLHALVGQDHAYPELSLASFLNAQGASAVEEMEQRMCVLELLQAFAGESLDSFTESSPLTAERLQRIEENRLGQRTIHVPVFQYHEEQDGLVAFDQARALRDQYCAQGVELTWRAHDTEGENGIIRHINLVYRGNAGVNDFIEARLAGEPPSSDCY